MHIFKYKYGSADGQYAVILKTLYFLTLEILKQFKFLSSQIKTLSINVYKFFLLFWVSGILVNLHLFHIRIYFQHMLSNYLNFVWSLFNFLGYNSYE